MGDSKFGKQEIEARRPLLAGVNLSSRLKTKRGNEHVTEQRAKRRTASRNSNFLNFQTDRPRLIKRRTDDLTNKKGNPGRQEASAIAEILSIWPKIVEYTGLSEYEAKVYLCLIGLGSSGARRLSLFCDVPRTKVYGTLKKLIDYGLVVEIPGTPKRFVPASPENAFSAILNIVKNKVNDFTSVVRILAETHEAVEKEAGPHSKIVWYLSDAKEIMEKCKEIIRQSKQTVTIFTSADGLSLLFNSTYKILDELQEQGVEVKLHSPLDPKKNPLARELSYLFEVTKVEVATPILFVNSDHQQFLLARIGLQGDEKKPESAIFSDDPTLLSMISLLLMSEKNPLKTVLL